MSSEQDYKEDVRQYLYHIKEINKLQQKMIEENRDDIQDLKTKQAVMQTHMDRFNVDHVDKVVVHEKTNKRDAALSGIAGGGVGIAIIEFVRFLIEKFIK